MTSRHILVSLLASALASVPLAHAADPLTLEKHLGKAQRIAPPFPTVPGKTLCICQNANDSNRTHLGYLNSITVNIMGDQTVNVVCAYPVFTPGLATGFCSLFEVVK